MSCCVYKITNIISGKMYIGSAVKYERRYNLHKSELRNNTHHNKPLQNAWNKYGEVNFKFEIIELCEKENLIEREQHYIDTLNPEYNVCKVAGSCLGIKRSEETRIKMSNSRTGVKRSKEACKNISKGKAGKSNRVGFKHTEETRLKMSQSSKNQTVSDKTRIKMSISAKNKPPMSNEEKIKLSKRMEGNQYGKGHKHTEETKAKISESSKRKRKPRTEEEKRKVSEGLKLFYANRKESNSISD